MTTSAGAEPIEDGAAESSQANGNYRLVLFVAGQSSRSMRAAAALRHICDQSRGACELTIVDVLERPQLAEDEKVLATPTVVRQRPLPARRVIGDLSNVDKVVRGLDLPFIVANLEEETIP